MPAGTAAAHCLPSSKQSQPMALSEATEYWNPSAGTVLRDLMLPVPCGANGETGARKGIMGALRVAESAQKTLLGDSNCLLLFLLEGGGSGRPGRLHSTQAKTVSLISPCPEL